jgi:hypothetical protein
MCGRTVITAFGSLARFKLRKSQAHPNSRYLVFIANCLNKFNVQMSREISRLVLQGDELGSLKEQGTSVEIVAELVGGTSAKPCFGNQYFVALGVAIVFDNVNTFQLGVIDKSICRSTTPQNVVTIATC